MPQLSILIGLDRAVHSNKWILAPNVRKQRDTGENGVWVAGFKRRLTP